MSALLMLFYWVGLPYLGFQLTKFLSQKASSWRRKAGCWLGYCSYIAFFLWIAVGRNMWLDAKIKALCAENGGIHVYETVALTPDLLDEKGRIHIPLHSSMKPDDKYCYDWLDKTIWKSMLGFVEIDETHYLIIRASDQKILGEKVYYSRHGIGLPVYWHTRSRTMCPFPSGDDVEDHVFVKQDG